MHTFSTLFLCLTSSLGWGGFCQNATRCVLRWERRLRNLPAKSRRCQCLIRARPRPYYFASKSDSVPSPIHKSWLHSRWHKRSLPLCGFWFLNQLQNTTKKQCKSLQPTSWWMILPYDVGVRPADGLAHQIDVAALVDCDILGYVGDPGGD